MLKRFLIFLLIVGVASNTEAQSNQENNLKELTASIKNDTNYVMNAIKLGTLYLNSQPDSALILSERALFIADRINYDKGRVYSLNLQGVLLTQLGNYTKALENFLGALKITEKNGFVKARATVLTCLGDLYSTQNEPRKALEYTFQAKEIFESIGDTTNLCISYINIGNYYEVMNSLDSAGINTEIGRVFAEKIDYKSGIGTALNNLGNIKTKSQQYKLAIEYYRLSFSYFLNTEDDDGLCESYLGIAKAFYATKELDSALHYATKSYKIAEAQKFTKFIYDASLFLSQYYQTNHNIDSAFVYQQTMIAAKDSLFNQEKVKQVQNLTINETLRQEKIAEEKLRAEEERKNNLQYIAIAVFIFIFSLIIILIVRQRIRLTTINFMVTVALLLIFEYISLLIHPTISFWTHHSPVYMLLILVGVASVLVPLHHRLEHWIKETLAHKIIHPRTKKVTFHTQEENKKNE